MHAPEGETRIAEPVPNSQTFIRTPVERLFRSSAFLKGISDFRQQLPFAYPEFCIGPNPTVKSAQMAYETGRQFAAWTGREARADRKAPISLGDLVRFIHSIDCVPASSKDR